MAFDINTRKLCIRSSGTSKWKSIHFGITNTVL